ncbi:uncharacterized protein N7511_005635 [Penicillium nucicola]|uniref:uncharacterized protein n=1 Tax=Penicillium nucicola TaxID=1850975 RepID=UPI0025453BE3|nr:uncharacterized protein N7511_005635 [Penicillium nucicola]KAJ5762253.1 hypothetical protein N7511_005635 [Penicillium nucicola]
MPTRSVNVINLQTVEDPEELPRYTGSPWYLFLSDVRLFFRNILYLPYIFLPIAPWPSGPLDELYPSLANILDVIFHSILFVLQLGFLLSLPFLIYVPFSLFVSYVVGVILLNLLLCQVLNRGIPKDGLRSTEDEDSRSWRQHDDECWIFLNGICVGKNWLQNNVDRLSRTFHRPVIGVHNRTSGVVFDIIQCLIQRSLLFATSDVRDCYVLVKKALYKKEVKKVILILHSQGGIEGSMIVDWLLNEVPQDLLQYLEVYTFGSIANHFNNPFRDAISHVSSPGSLSNGETSGRSHNRAIPHVEHYANSYDFASRFGVLHFTKKMPNDQLENRFMGNVFVNPKAGHQLNQHYLDSMFPLDPTNRFTRDPKDTDFMNLNVIIHSTQQAKLPDSIRPETVVEILDHAGIFRDFSQEPATATEVLNLSPVSPLSGVNRWTGEPNSNRTRPKSKLKIRDLSRLWLYRNGGRPA